LSRLKHWRILVPVDYQIAFTPINLQLKRNTACRSFKIPQDWPSYVHQQAHGNNRERKDRIQGPSCHGFP
jgi:hypothetical protein